VLLAVSVEDLLRPEAAQSLEKQASLLRARLSEMRSTLRASLPVHVLLTKCDLVPGFMDWFGGLPRVDREQAWGITFQSGTTSEGRELADAFGRFVDRFADSLAGRLHAEQDPRRRARIYSLSSQLHALAEPLAMFARELRIDARPSSRSKGGVVLRGVYLTSGTQGGTPIDRMLAAFGRELGLERQILPPNQIGDKSFFITRLLKDVVFGETASDRARAPGGGRPRTFAAALLAVVLIAAVALGAWWTSEYFRAKQSMARVEGEIARLSSVLASGETTSDADPRRLLPVLNSLRDLSRMRLQPGTPLERMSVAASSSRKLAVATGQRYARALQGPFAKGITQAIERTLSGNADPNMKYEALKSYQMLNDAKHFDPASLALFATSFWKSSLNPPLQAAEQRDLRAHLDALLEAGPLGVSPKLDPTFIDTVRLSLLAQPATDRITSRLDALLDASTFADFDVAALSAATGKLFVGADGKSAPRRVPGKYTLDAYRNVVLAQVPQLAKQLDAESEWVLGLAATPFEGDAARVVFRYRASYTQAWARMLDDLHLGAAADSQEKASQAQLLGAADGPLAQVLGEIVRQTPLRLPNGAEGPITAVDPAADRLLALASLLVRDSNGGTPLDGPLQAFREISNVRRADESGTAVADAAARLSRIASYAQSQVEPVQSMLVALAGGSAVSKPSAGVAAQPARLETPPATAATQAAPRPVTTTRPARATPPAATAAPATSVSPGTERIASASAPEVKPTAAPSPRRAAGSLSAQCVDLIAGRFPFDRRATRDASFAEVARVFGPKGAFDQAFTQRFAGRVDTSSDPWRWTGPGAAPPAEELERFHAAARIRDVLFARGSTRPALQLTFRPLDLDEEIDRFELEIDGQTVRYAHGPALPVVVKWPGATGSARIEVSPARPGAPLDFTGPWALFRLFDRAAVQEAGSPGRLRAVFDVNGRKATFEVQTDAAANPFRLRELERFECPLAGQ
jgi:type VI secretion system protein ImpL